MQKKTKSAPAPSRARTDRDWVMIGLGLLLVAVFLFAGYLSFPRLDGTGKPGIRGPVKDPSAAGYLMEPPSNKNPFRRAYG